MLTEKEFVASVFRTFNLNLDTLPSRIALQKTVYLLNQLGVEPRFNYTWHNFGPYSSTLARVAFSLTEDQITKAPKIESKEVTIFLNLKEDFTHDSRFLEMLSDIIYLNKERDIKKKEDLFRELVSHQDYLNDINMFNLAFTRLTSSNLI